MARTTRGIEDAAKASTMMKRMKTMISVRNGRA
jgi:hypothetical protein